MEATESHKLKAANTIPDSLVGQDRWLSPTRPGFNSRSGKPPELRWQSGRLLTDRSLVRSQVVAIRFFCFLFLNSFFFIFKLSVSLFQQHHEPMAQRQRVGFQTRRLGVQIPLGSLMPPELRWQSGRLLTDRSLVRSQVVAHYFFFSPR